MGWFDEQLKQRKLSDQEVFEDSFMQLAMAVTGGKNATGSNDKRYFSKQAIDEILQYYHKKPIEIPESITDFDEQLDYALRPYGIMRRLIKLEPGWYKDSFGPVLAFYKDNNVAEALIPNLISGYSYSDNTTGLKSKVDKNSEQIFDEDAICFYRPLALKKLGIPDLLLYLKDTITPGDIVVIAVLTLITTLIGMIGPKLTQLLTGPVLNSKSISVLVSMAIFMICTNIATMLINVTKSLAMTKVQSKSSLQVQAAVMMRLMSLPANFFRKYSSGELASRAGSVNSLCDMLLSSTFSTGITSLMSLLYIGQIFTFAPALVVPSLVIITSTVVLGVVSSLLNMNINRKMMKLGAQQSGMSYAMLSGIQKIKLSGAEKRAFARWANLFAENAQLTYNPPVFLKLNGVIISAISLFGNILLSYLAIKSGVDQSGYYAFTASYGLVSGAFNSLASIVLSLSQIKPILEMAEPILNEVPEISEGKEVITKINGNIEISNVSFRYDENSPYIIDNLSLKIHSGEYIAIVGKTGCGKSTLIRLLLGFEKPEKGAIYYDGKDITKIDMRSLRRKIGTVNQSGSLFSGDIFSNISISAPNLTLDEAWKAAEIAGIADDIRNMPMGMHTLISEGQGGISGGQKQRIMIARAVAGKPKILIFDEATSALDNKTQKQVSEALDQLECTRIVIAHRLSTIRHCDRILVLDSGKIIEDGTYEELIKNNGFFAELVERQRLDKES